MELFPKWDFFVLFDSNNDHVGPPMVPSTSNITGEISFDA